MNLLVLAALSPLAVVPEPIYNLGQFLFGLLYLLSLMGGGR